MPLTRLLQAVEPDARLLGANTLAGGISAGMTAVEATLRDGRRHTFVVRVPAHGAAAARREFSLLRHLRATGIPVPNPRLLDEPGRFLGVPALVLDHVEGAPRFNTDDGPVLMPRLAAALADIHRVDGRMPAFAGLPSARAEAVARLDRRPVEPGEPASLTRVRAALRAHPLPPNPPRPVLLHGDFWPGNVIWAGDAVAAVIDWEEPAIGDPLADVAISRLDVLWVFGPAAMASFTEHYLASRPCDIDALPLWDLAAALRPAGHLSAWAAQYPAFGRPDVTSTSMRAAHRWFVDQALAALG